MEKKQTAVEWLVDQIKSEQNQKNLSANDWMQVIEKAKEMEKEQIVDAHLLGLIYPLEIEATKQAEQYYKETYGKETDRS